MLRFILSQNLADEVTDVVSDNVNLLVMEYNREIF